MTRDDYFGLVRDTALEIIEECEDGDSAARPSTLIDEKTDGILDRNWSDEDAFACLQYSKHPSAAEFYLGGDAESADDPFPFKFHALSAFRADIGDVLIDEQFSIGDADAKWEERRGE